LPQAKKYFGTHHAQGNDKDNLCLDEKREPAMNAVTLKINGAIDHNGARVESDILSCLSSQIILEAGYTLRSFFEMVDQYRLLVELNTFFPECMKQYRQCPPEGCAAGVADYLEFSKTVELIGFPEKRLEIYNSFSGVGENGAFEIRSLQLESLLDLPVKLGRLKHVIFGDPVDIFEFDTVFTLFDFIEGIAWQLSFHVIPTQCEFRR
jgi:hypothetical protein